MIKFLRHIYNFFVKYVVVVDDEDLSNMEETYLPYCKCSACSCPSVEVYSNYCRVCGAMLVFKHVNAEN
ncbi:MAG: hypothetical protein GY861_21975 [bacterium]|nr:hypothetical protein [bacterium]